MNKSTFDNLPPEKKIEILSKLIKGEMKLEEDIKLEDIFPGISKFS